MKLCINPDVKRCEFLRAHLEPRETRLSLVEATSFWMRVLASIYRKPTPRAIGVFLNVSSQQCLIHFATTLMEAWAVSKSLLIICQARCKNISLNYTRSQLVPGANKKRLIRNKMKVDLVSQGCERTLYLFYGTYMLWVSLSVTKTVVLLTSAWFPNGQ